MKDRMEPERQLVTPVAAVQVPSPDLINFRFNQTDQRIDDMSNKVDALGGKFDTFLQALDGKFVGQVEYSRHIRDYEQFKEDITKTLHEAVNEVKRSRWIQNTASAVLGAVLAAMSYALIVGRVH